MKTGKRKRRKGKEERMKGKKKGNDKRKRKEPKGKETLFSGWKNKKISGPLGLLITLYAVKIFDVPRLLMSGAMKNA